MNRSKQEILYQALYIGLPIKNSQGMILFMGEDGGIYCTMFSDGEVHSAVAIPTDMGAFYSWAESLTDSDITKILADIGLNMITLDKIKDDDIDQFLRERRADTINNIQRVFPET